MYICILYVLLPSLIIGHFYHLFVNCFSQAYRNEEKKENYKISSHQDPLNSVLACESEVQEGDLDMNGLALQKYVLMCSQFTNGGLRGS